MEKNKKPWAEMSREEKRQFTLNQMAAYYGVTPESLEMPEEKWQKVKQQILLYKEQEKRAKQQQK